MITQSHCYKIKAEKIGKTNIFLPTNKEEEIKKEKEAQVIPRFFNLLEQNHFFTGREKEITEICSTLLKNKSNILVIEGMSAIGKTQIAKKYAYDFLDRYDLIWWFDSEKNRDVQAEDLLKKILQHEGQPYYRPVNSLSLAKKLRDKLSSLKLNWLLIFDDFENMASITQYAPLNDDGIFTKHVIITSKKMNSTYPSLVIHKFQRKESLAFLSKILTKEKPEELNALAEALGDFPLALAQAASYIKMNPSIDVNVYLQLFKENYFDLSSSEEKTIGQSKNNMSFNDNYNKTVANAIKMNIDSIKNRSPLAYEMLCFCSLFSHQHIPLDILESWACDKHGNSKREFHEALSLLLNFFLMEKENKTGETYSTDLFNQHELIQLIIADVIPRNTRKIILKEASECLLQDLLNFPGTLQEQFKGKEHYYNHMEKLSRTANDLGYKGSHIDELNIALLYNIHFIQHDFSRSAKLIRLFNSLSHNNISSLAQLWFYCTVLNDQMFEGFSQVQQSYKKGLECLERILDNETKKSYLLHLNINYVESLSNFGRLKEAISLCDSLKEILKTTENKSQKIAFLGVSALIRLKYGQYEQSLKDLEYCFEVIWGQKDIENYVPFFMVTKAHCFLYQGKVEQAYQIIEEYYPHLLETFVSPECMVLVNTQLIKGACLASFGKLEEAMHLVQTSLSAYEKSTGFANDTLKGMGYRILGEIFEAKGNLKKSYEEYRKAENFYEHILQEKNLDDLGLLYTQLAILGAKQRDDEMVSKYLSLHIKHFGLTHPRTFKIKRFLDYQGLSLP